MSNQIEIAKRFNLVYTTLKESGKFHTDRELADIIGYKPQTLNEILKGRTKFNLDFLQIFCNTFNVSLDFLALGITKPNEPNMLHNKSVTKSVTKSVLNQKDIKCYTTKDIEHSPEGKFPKQNGSGLVPYYDVDFAAGVDIMMFDDSSVTPAYYMDIPEFSGCKAFRAYSDSMEKLIKSGSILFGTKEASWLEHLEFGQIYGIVCTDGRRYLKYIRRAENNSEYFLLRSENKDYDDFEIPKRVIRSIWLIHGWLHRRT
jgi:phage repressor protein C with HTH and peptisase S24 domain